MALVEDVAFGRLDNEDDAEGEWRRGFGRAVVLVCGGEAEGEGGGAGVGGKSVGFDDWRRGRWVG